VTVVRGIRGATTAGEDSSTEIVAATTELLEALTRENDILPDQVAGVWFTTTPDLSSEFPAIAARRMGWVDVPLICGQEMDVPYANPRSIPRCIRTMILINTEREQAQMRFIYLRGARAIKEELDRAKAGQPPEPAVTATGPRPSSRQTP